MNFQLITSSFTKFLILQKSLNVVKLKKHKVEISLKFGIVLKSF